MRWRYIYSETYKNDLNILWMQRILMMNQYQIWPTKLFEYYIKIVESLGPNMNFTDIKSIAYIPECKMRVFILVEMMMAFSVVLIELYRF
jgi:hypothetical protein